MNLKLQDLKLNQTTIIQKSKSKQDSGVGAVEVPRGILFHDYTYNDKGICTKANCIIPTNQNHGNIQLDMKALLPQILDKPQKEIELTLGNVSKSLRPMHILLHTRSKSRFNLSSGHYISISNY